MCAHENDDNSGRPLSMKIVVEELIKVHSTTPVTSSYLDVKEISKMQFLSGLDHRGSIKKFFYMNNLFLIFNIHVVGYLCTNNN